jgi:hypothetical protein
MRSFLALTALLAASLAHAGGGSGSGFELGLRGMFQTPFGSRNSQDMAVLYSPGFALELEAGARFANAHVSILGFVATGPVWTQSPDAPEAANGNVAVMNTRFGGELHIRPFSSIAFQPWFGIGLGAEAMSGDWAFIFTPQGGIDLRLGILGIGPYVEVPFGTWFRAAPAAGGSGDFHGWFTAGLRLSFAPRPD